MSLTALPRWRPTYRFPDKPSTLTILGSNLVLLGQLAKCWSRNVANLVGVSITRDSRTLTNLRVLRSVGLRSRGEPMLMSERCCILLLLLLLCTYAVHAQDAKALAVRDAGRVHLNIVVTEKSGAPVSGLQLEDFTLLDNNAPQTITSFQAVEGQEAGAKIILVIDAVNSGAREVAIEREEIKRFLKAEGGRLAFPTTFAVLTETGIQLHLGVLRDGNALSSALDYYKIPMRGNDRDTDRGGTAARLYSSFDGFAQLLAEERDKPGRKLVVWMSPGWPFSSHALDAKQRQ